MQPRSQGLSFGKMRDPRNEVARNAVGTRADSPVPFPDLYFVSFSYPAAPIVSSAEGIV